MEIDFREVPEAEWIDRTIAAFGDLKRDEILTLLCGEDPESLSDSVANVLGAKADIQRMRWGIKDLAWVLHIKKSLAPSSYQPPE